LLNQERITIIGSGQSAAEIFQDLLTNGNANKQLSWFTRSPRFHPMEVGKLTWEMTSPDYVDYFYGLPSATKRRVVAQQGALYKGINQGLISEIYDQLYLNNLDHPDERVKLYPNYELRDMVSEGDVLQMQFDQAESNQLFSTMADTVILATGFNSADLGMGPYRNAGILNTILGYEHFLLEKHVAFQTFGVRDKE
jgi:lysine N6-hydroxylase